MMKGIVQGMCGLWILLRRTLESPIGCNDQLPKRRNNLCKKMCSGIGAVRRIKSFVPLCSSKMLYKALIQPYFDYCSLCWIHAVRFI